jgi:hypothetical protein
MTSLHFQITDASSIAVGLARESEVCALPLSQEIVAAQCPHPLQEHLHAVWLIEVGSACAVSDTTYFDTRIESYFCAQVVSTKTVKCLDGDLLQLSCNWLVCP